MSKALNNDLTPDELSDLWIGMVRDLLTVDELVALAQRAHIKQDAALRDELHGWIGVRYATDRVTTMDTPYQIGGAA